MVAGPIGHLDRKAMSMGRECRMREDAYPFMSVAGMTIVVGIKSGAPAVAVGISL